MAKKKASEESSASAPAVVALKIDWHVDKEIVGRYATQLLPVGPMAAGWEIVSPIVVELEKDDDGEYLVSDRFSTVYGNGNSEATAITDYCLSLIDYYEILDNQSAKNSRSMLAIQKLAAYLKRVKT